MFAIVDGVQELLALGGRDIQFDDTGVVGWPERDPGVQLLSKREGVVVERGRRCAADVLVESALRHALPHALTEPVAHRASVRVPTTLDDR
jgi:hypothetical protein